MPGLRLRIPYLHRIDLESTETRKTAIEIKESLYTQDGVLLTADFGIIWQIAHPAIHKGLKGNSLYYGKKFLDAKVNIESIIKEIIIDIARTGIHAYKYDDIKAHKKLIMNFIRYFIRYLANEEINENDNDDRSRLEMSEQQRMADAETDGVNAAERDQIRQIFLKTRVSMPSVIANKSLLEAAGIYTLRVTIDDLEPDPSVVRAHQDVEIAKAQVPAAEAKAQVALIEANAQAEVQRRVGAGEADRRSLLFKAEITGQAGLEAVRTENMQHRKAAGVGDWAIAAGELAGALADKVNGATKKKE